MVIYGYYWLLSSQVLNRKSVRQGFIRTHPPFLPLPVSFCAAGHHARKRMLLIPHELSFDGSDYSQALCSDCDATLGKDSMTHNES